MDIISVNNTLGYILDFQEVIGVLKNIYRILKPDGIFITDLNHDSYKKIFSADVTNEIYPGIYQKIKDIDINKLPDTTPKPTVISTADGDKFRITLQ